MTIALYLALAYIVVVVTLLSFTAGGSHRELRWQAQIEGRLLRDVDLRMTYDRLEKELGRPPTTAELWAVSPPLFDQT
jgi:hypothetical protein